MAISRLRTLPAASPTPVLSVRKLRISFGGGSVRTTSNVSRASEYTHLGRRCSPRISLSKLVVIGFDLLQEGPCTSAIRGRREWPMGRGLQFNLNSDRKNCRFVSPL